MKTNKEMIKYIYIPLLLGLLSFTSCKENEVMDYDLPARVYIHEIKIENTIEVKLTERNYSFALRTTGPVLDEDTVKVSVKLMGSTENRDRIFRAEVDGDNSTAIAGTHYKLLDGVLKANEFEGYIPLVIYRTPDTKDQAVHVVLKLVETADLGLGNPAYLTFKVIWGDLLLPPANWPYFFGIYSTNKYRFAIDNLGLTDWPQATRWATGPEEGIYTGSQLQAFAAQLNRDYAIYRIEHGPIYREDDAENKIEINYTPGY